MATYSALLPGSMIGERPCAKASGEQLAYAPLRMADIVMLPKRIQTNKKEEIYVVKFSNMRKIQKKKRIILHFSAFFFLVA